MNPPNHRPPRSFACWSSTTTRVTLRQWPKRSIALATLARSATSGPEGAQHIDQDSFDVVITDLVMNEVDGEEILRRAKESLPDCEVIVVTGHASVPKAVEAMQQGAFNFLEKPLTPDRLRAVTEKAADAVQLKLANVDLHQRLDERFGFEGIIYASDKMKAVIERLKRLAPTDASVLITGETGTGKELVAQAVAPEQSAQEKAVCRVELRRAERTFTRERTVRTCTGRLHRRPNRPSRPIRIRPRRYTLPGRSRRHADADSDQAS